MSTAGLFDNRDTPYFGLPERFETRAQMIEDERRWLRESWWCRCSRPRYCRVYIGLWACRVCGRLIRWTRVAAWRVR